MRIADLFCCAGLSGEGVYEATHAEIVGFDTEPQPRYPFTFVRMDALEVDLSEFDAVWASPPCQHYSDLAHRTGRDYPDLIPATRAKLERSGKPWIIENVEGAPLRDYVTLCGTMFPQLRVLRHRIFEASFPIVGAGDCRPHPRCHTLDKRKSQYGLTDEWVDYVSVNGGGNCTVAAAKDAMGVARPLLKYELNQGVPPVFAYHMARQYPVLAA